MYGMGNVGASLDFGVFVCSNCSGAHRGLGPTVTRVKSTHLDQWRAEWVDSMRLGNDALNAFWEANAEAAAAKYASAHSGNHVPVRL
jgi:stromal membrane-associated protein